MPRRRPILAFVAALVVLGAMLFFAIRWSNSPRQRADRASQAMRHAMSDLQTAEARGDSQAAADARARIHTAEQELEKLSRERR
jgi:Flp pilus assembly protein TadB